MITIEELIVESLYHRLVLITVRRTSGTSGGDSGVNSSNEGASSVIPDENAVVPAEGLGYLCLGNSRDSGAVQVTGQPVRVTRQVQTVLDPDEVALLQSSSCCAEVQTDFEPMWYCGDTTLVMQNHTGNDSLESQGGLIDMRGYDQFSVMRVEDKRDPGAQSFVMVQPGSSVHPSRPMGPGGDANSLRYSRTDSTDTYPTVTSSPCGSVEVLASPAMFVGDSNGHWKRELEFPSIHRHDGGGFLQQQPADVDSGIWDVVQALTSNGDDCGRIDDPETASRWTSAEGATANAAAKTVVSEIQANDIQPNLQGVYKMFQMADDPSETSATSSSHDEAMLEVGPQILKGHGGGLGDVLEPMAVVNFVVHRVEAETIRMERIDDMKTSGSTGKCPLQSRKPKITNSNGESQSDTRKSVSSEAGASSSASGDTLDGNDAVEEHAAHVGHNSKESEVHARPPVAQKTTATEKTRKRHKDIVRITSVRLGRSTRRQFGAGRRRGWKTSGHEPKMCQSADISRCSSLLDVNTDQHDADLMSQTVSAARSSETLPEPSPERIPSRGSDPTPRTTHVQHPSLCHLASSPYDSWQGGRASGARNLSAGSLEWLADGVVPASSVSSVSTFDLFSEPDLLDFEKFPDWMRDLPVTLHSVPLNDICIPGSHVSVAIERDMRTDLEFSKCNYEMAEFLRKLPDLALFNNFRALMKNIWKAWMPKQCLCIYDQLMAGARYLDIRVTKLAGTLHGEHGLYSRPLKAYLRDIRRFIEEHTSEIVILHFQSSEYLDRTDKRHLVTSLFQAFGAKMACSATLTPNTDDLPSLKQLWSAEKQIIVFFPCSDMELIRNHIFGGLVWSDNAIRVVAAPKTQTVAELANALDVAIAASNKSEPTCPRKQLHVVKAVLSPDMSMVFGRYEYRSMRELSTYETSKAVSCWIGSKMGLNIVIVDFIGIGDSVRRLLQLNVERAPSQ